MPRVSPRASATLCFHQLPHRIAILSGLAAALFCSIASAQPGRVANVAVAPLVQEELATAQDFVGTVAPLRISNVGSAVDGRVVDYPVNEGDRVAKGDVIAQLLTGQLEIQVAGAKAQLKVYEHQLTELKNGVRQEEREQIQAQLRSRQAMLDYMSAKLNRFQRLAKSGTASENELQETTAAAEQAREAHAEAKLAYELALKGPRQERIAQAEAQVAVQREAINALEDQLNKHTIRAPFDGYLSVEHTEIGQWLSRGGLVAKIVELDQVDVHVHIPESYLPFLKVGESARVEVTALPEHPFVGNVAVIVPEADPRSRSFPVKIRLKNVIEENRPLLRAGMFARVHLPVGRRGTALLAPKDAIVLGRGAPIVFVVDRDSANPDAGKARAVQMQLGVAQGAMIEVIGNLKAGELVIVQGNERLRGGESVRIVQQPREQASAR